MGLKVRRRCASLHNGLDPLQIWSRLQSEGEKAVEVTVLDLGLGTCLLN